MIRPRTSADLDALEVIAAEVHELDGYPSFVGPDHTLRSFIAPDDALASWVAFEDGGVVGQVVLRPRSAPGSVVLAARALGVEVESLAFVARLLVAPRGRRRGIARALLECTVDEAHRLRRRTVLDVVTRDVAAIALYDASGWRRLGSHTMTLPSGELLDLHVYEEPGT